MSFSSCLGVFFDLFSQFDLLFAFGFVGVFFGMLMVVILLFCGVFMFSLYDRLAKVLLSAATLSIVWGFLKPCVVFLVFWLVIINLIGIIPFGFSISSQIWFSLWLAVFFYAMTVLIFFCKSIVFPFSHIVPVGSPLLLGLGLFWVEVVSNLIRPFTLVLRLCANILAGHVMVSVFSGIFIYVCFASFSLVSVMFFFVCCVFFIFEFAVCLVQGGVFCLLVVSYFLEVE